MSVPASRRTGEKIDRGIRHVIQKNPSIDRQSDRLPYPVSLRQQAAIR